MTQSIRIELDAAPLLQVLDEVSAALEHAPELIRNEFLRGLDALLARLADCDLSTASGAGDGVVRLEFPPGWVAELRAVAARARQVDCFAGHGGPYAK